MTEPVTAADVLAAHQPQNKIDRATGQWTHPCTGCDGFVAESLAQFSEHRIEMVRAEGLTLEDILQAQSDEDAERHHEAYSMFHRARALARAAERLAEEASRQLFLHDVTFAQSRALPSPEEMDLQLALPAQAAARTFTGGVTDDRLVRNVLGNALAAAFEAEVGNA